MKKICMILREVFANCSRRYRRFSQSSRSPMCASSSQLMDPFSPKIEPGVPTIVNVDLGNRSYPIYLGSGLLNKPELLQRAETLKRTGVEDRELELKKEIMDENVGEPWQIADQTKWKLCLNVLKLKKSFDSFSIQVVPHGNPQDPAANGKLNQNAMMAVYLEDGEVEEVLEEY